MPVYSRFNHQAARAAVRRLRELAEWRTLPLATLDEDLAAAGAALGLGILGGTAAG